MKPLRSLSLSSLFLVLAACGNEAPRALGTLEWDRITLPSPAAEKIVGIEVREGQRVKAGDALLRLEAGRTQSQLAAAEAQARQSGAAPPGGHLKFSKQGFPSIYTGATAGDHRAGRITSQAPATREAGADG